MNTQLLAGVWQYISVFAIPGHFLSNVFSVILWQYLGRLSIMGIYSLGIFTEYKMVTETICVLNYKLKTFDHFYWWKSHHGCTKWLSVPGTR